MRKNFVLFSLFLFALFVFVQPAQAQDERNNYGFFKLGYHSKIESSLSNKFAVGGGVGIKLCEKCNLFVEPSVVFSLSGEKLFLILAPFEKDALLPVWASPKTMLFDFNGLYDYRPKERVSLGFGGGLGLLRNWLSSPDAAYLKYYFGVKLPSDNHLAKNVGLSAKYFLGEEQSVFVGAEFRSYWAGGESFRLVTGQVGFKF